MATLKELTDLELQSKIIEYNFKHESSGFAKFDRMIETLKREKARRFWEKYQKPKGSKSAAEVESRARLLFHS